MNIPAEVKPALWGAVAGAVALALVGFWWGGWKTAASARDLVEAGSQKAVVVALAPLCVAKFNAQADAPAKLGALKKLATSRDHVVPGHDPLVLAHYPAAKPGLEGWVARLDADPKT